MDDQHGVLPPNDDRIEAQLSKRKVSVIAMLALLATIAVLAIWSRSRAERRDEIAGEATITSGAVDPGAMGVTGAVRIPNDMAIERLAYVTCAHRAACASIGTTAYDEPSVGNAECSQDARDTLNVELDQAAAACVIGIDALSLDTCAAAIEAEPCGRPAHAPRSLALCRASALCPH